MAHSTTGCVPCQRACGLAYSDGSPAAYMKGSGEQPTSHMSCARNSARTSEASFRKRGDRRGSATTSATWTIAKASATERDPSTVDLASSAKRSWRGGGGGGGGDRKSAKSDIVGEPRDDARSCRRGARAPETRDHARKKSNGDGVAQRHDVVPHCGGRGRGRGGTGACTRRDARPHAHLSHC